MAERNVFAFGRDFLAVNVHCFNAENGVRLVNTDVDRAEEGRVASCGVKLFKEDERADEHQKAVCKLHSPAEIECYSRSADCNSRELVYDELRQHEQHRRQLHTERRLSSFFNRGVYLCGGVACQIEILDLRYALYIFENLCDKAFVGVEFSLRERLFLFLHGRVYGKEQYKSCKSDKTHAPIENEHHNGDDSGSQKTARRYHYHTSCDVCHVLHCVGGDACDLS